MMASQQHSIVLSGLLMILISFVLFWAPLLGPAIAGFVGGKWAGSIPRALVAAFLPGLLLAGMLILMFSVFGLPLLGIVAGLGLGLLIMIDELALIAGAIIGGALAR